MPIQNNSITPIQGRLLIETKGKYANLGTTTEEKWGTSKVQGVVKAIAADIVDKCNKEFNIEVGDIVYFGKFEDSAPYGPDDNLILLKLEEIGGRSDAD